MHPLDVTDPDGSPLAGTAIEPGVGGGSLDLISGDAVHLRGDFTQGRYLAFLVTYQGLHHSLLALRFVLRGDRVPRMYVHAAMLPDQEAPLIIDLHQLDGQHATLTRTPGMLRASCHGEGLDPAAIDHVELELVRTGLDQRCVITPPQLYASHPPVRVPGRRLLDEFGQLAIRDWPGCTRSALDLCARLRAEARQPDVPTPPEPPPDAHFYRTQLRDGRWWLIDPTGEPCFSSGLTHCVDGPATAIVPGTEAWYSWIPERSGQFGDCRKEDAARGAPLALYPRANLRRAFEDGWRSTWQRLTANRLRRWGFHALGCGSDPQLAALHRFPFVKALDGFPETTLRLWRGLPDVFDPAFESAAEIFARQLDGLADDRRMIGYLIHREPAWSVPADALSAALLTDDRPSHTRRAMAEVIAGRYAGDVDRWRESWDLDSGTRFVELEERSFAGRIGRSAGVHGDLVAAGQAVLARAVGVVAQACRRAAPQHLDLGIVASPGAVDLLACLGREADVLTLTGHRILPDRESIARLSAEHDRPVLVVGFEVGAIDRGLLGTGHRAVPSTPDRAIAYRRHLEHCAALPEVIGCHISRLVDHPALGDIQGRCGNVGLVDVCQRPYDEVVDAIAEANARLAALHRGEVDPVADRVREITAIAV